jgi:hypothetical protein
VIPLARDTIGAAAPSVKAGIWRCAQEVYHSTWFNESRRIESVKAHAALGGRLVHGCQSVPNQSGGACVPIRVLCRGVLCHHQHNAPIRGLEHR